MRFPLLVAEAVLVFQESWQIRRQATEALGSVATSVLVGISHAFHPSFHAIGPQIHAL